MLAWLGFALLAGGAATPCPGTTPQLPAPIYPPEPEPPPPTYVFGEALELVGSPALELGGVPLHARADEGEEGVSLRVLRLEGDESGAGEHEDGAAELEAAPALIELRSSFASCTRSFAELARIEGASEDLLVAQLLCDSEELVGEAELSATVRDSLTVLLRVAPGASAAEVLWRGEGWSRDTAGACVAYEVYAFALAESKAAVRVEREHEQIPSADAEELELSCPLEIYEREPVQVIALGPTSGPG